MTDDTIRDTSIGRPDPLIGRILDGRYEIRAPLGSGGMGSVYRGWQRSVDREVAIKVIDPKLAANRDGVKRFLREARLASRLSAPTIVSVFDFGHTDDDILYIVMELLRGQTLAHAIAAGPLDLARTLDVALQLCDALETAHTAGIVHRDLKPGNVVILDEPAGRGLVKVLDFGLAKSLVDDGISLVTHSAALIGTPLYMSPEQIQGKPSDQRADIYSLGCMLHEMMSGTSPFGAKTIDRILSNHLYEISAPMPPTIPLELAELIRRAIAKDPSDRPANAAEVRAALIAIRDAPPPKPDRRRWWFGGAAAAIVVGAGVAIAVVAARDSSTGGDRTGGTGGSDRTAVGGERTAVLPVDAATDTARDAAIDAPGHVSRPTDAIAPPADTRRSISRPLPADAAPADSDGLDFYPHTNRLD